jgi:hypothetical protein
VLASFQVEADGMVHGGSGDAMAGMSMPAAHDVHGGLVEIDEDGRMAGRARASRMA